MSPDPQYIVYTSQTGDPDPVCHGYGPGDEAAAQAAGVKLGGSEVTVSVLPVIPLSSKYPIAGGDALYLIYRTVFGYGDAGQTYAYVTTDPAAGDALGGAWEAAGEAFSYMVLSLEPLPA